MKLSYWIAFAILAAVAGWVLSGQFGRPEGELGAVQLSARPADEAAEPVAVRVRRQTARDYRREIVIRGRTEASRVVELKAETPGRVVEVGARRGQPVAAGELVVRLALDDRDARLAEALARVKQREVEHFAAKALAEKGFRADTQLAEAEARLEAAKSVLVAIEDDIAKTTLAAPFDGVLEDRYVELGSYLQPGDAVASLVDLDPIRIVGEVAEREVGALVPGRRASARLVTGEVVEGEIRYIARVADPRTRTFRVEIEVANPDARLRDGVTSEIRVPAETLRAHLVSRAVLALDDDGVIGIKLLDADDTVRFHPARIVGDGPEGLWLAGLPETIRVITVGQEFVRDGQKVRVVETTAGEPDAGAAP